MASKLQQLINHVRERDHAPDYASCAATWTQEVVDYAICQGHIQLFMDTESMILLLVPREAGEPMFDSLARIYEQETRDRLRQETLTAANS